MATLLDTFFTRLGFEIDEPALASAQSKIAGLGKSLLGLGIFSGLSVAGIFKLTQSTATALATVQKMSDRTGIATESIAGMTKAAAEFDVPAEGLRGSLENVNRTLGGIVTNTAPRMVKVFQNLGLTARDAAGQQKDVVTFLGDVADKIQGMSTGAQQQILSRLGIDQNMIMMLRNGRTEFMRLYETARAGIPHKAADYQRAAELEKGFRQVKSAITEVGQTIGIALMPALKDMITRFMTWWKTDGKTMLLEFRQKIEGWVESINKVAARFHEMTGGANLFTTAAKAVVAIIGAMIALKFLSWIAEGVKGLQLLTTVIKGVNVATTLAMGKFLLIAAAVALVGVAIYAVIQDFRDWQKGVPSVLGDIEKRFPQLFGIIRKGAEFLRDAFKGLWTAIKEFWVQNKPVILLLGKALAIVGGIIVGVVVVALGLLLYWWTLVYTKLLTGITKLTTWLSKMIPIETLQRYLKQFQENFMRSLDEIEAGWKSATRQIREIWEATTNTLKAIWAWVVDQWNAELERFMAGWKTLKEGVTAVWNGLKTLWQGALDGFANGWQSMSDRIRSIWDSLIGWMKPWLERIEKFFNFVSDKAGGLANKVAGALPTLAAGAISPRMELAGVGGGWGVPPVVPTNTISNANASTVNSNNTDMKVTMNVNGAESPQATADAVSDQLSNTWRTATRHAQTALR